MLRLRTLGTLDLRNSDDLELRHVLTQPRRLALLVYLALAKPRGFQRRDTLIALFWAEQSSERARASLSRALYFLRRELGPDIVISRGDEEVGLDPDRFWCDAAAFEENLAAHRLRDGLGLYGGDLLPGFFAPDAKGFEEWLEHQRSTLRDGAAAALGLLAAEEERVGNRAQAVQWARRGVELAPFSEEALQRLLLALDGAGDRAAASRAYQEFAERLAVDLELRPSPETQSLIAAIRSREQANHTGSNGLVDHRPVESDDGSSGQPVASGAGLRRLRWRLVGLGVAVASIVALLGWWWVPLSSRRVYVAPFSYAESDLQLARLSRVAVDHIIQRAAATGLVDVVTEPSVRPRAGITVQGTVSREGGRLRIETRITDVRRRRIVWTLRSEAVAPDSVPDTDALSRRIAGGVVALGMPRLANWFPVASAPPFIEAFLEFTRADELQCRGADRDALPHLERAVALDPAFVWAELQWAAAYLNLFDSRHADPMVAALSRKRDRLNLLQRHWLDWMRSLEAEDVPGGYEALSAAARLAPERFLYDKARWATFLNRPRETIALLEALGPDSPYNGGTPGYWRHLTRSWHALGEYDAELAAARRSRRYAVAPIVSRSFEGIALAALGRSAELRALLDTVLTLPTDRGTSPRQLMAESGTSPGQLMILVAEELRAHGHEAQAEETLARAADWYATQPPDAAVDRSRRFDLGMAAYYARDWARAEAIFRSLVDEDPDNFVYLGRLGTTAARRGDQTTARQILARFNGFRGTLPMPHTSVGYWQSKITMLLGDEQRALSLMTESIGPQGRAGMHADFDFERIWSTALFRDFVRPKG